jgi:hypothetical protein
MPTGEPTTEPLVDGNEVRWSSGDSTGPGDNVVTQRINVATDADIAGARQADITFINGLTVSVLPSTSVSDAADLFVFDTGTDCVPLVNTSPFVPDDVLETYGQTLLQTWSREDSLL